VHFKRKLLRARAPVIFRGLCKIDIAIRAVGYIAWPHAHNSAYHSGSSIDRIVAGVAVQHWVGLLPGRRIANPDHFDPCTLARIEPPDAEGAAKMLALGRERPLQRDG